MKCDAENRAKANRGQDLPWAKLTDDDVRLMRRLHQEGRAEIDRIRSYCTMRALAEKFGVHRRTVEKVLSYSTWRHVE